MGEALHEFHRSQGGVATRIYAPVGSHEDLLAYLVRRLLENGANTSFVNRLADDEAPIADIVADPVGLIASLQPASQSAHSAAEGHAWRPEELGAASSGAIPRSASRCCSRWTPSWLRRIPQRR